MAAGQQFLFAPEKPLVRRLGQRFFRRIPDRPGVYKMRDAQGEIVYVGKAKNLKHRLRSYRTANPERMPRRHLRMVREVAWIEFDLCHNESAALAREAKLLRELKPKFNRAGVWPGRAQFLTWRFAEQTGQFSVHEIPPLGWERYGSLGGYAPRLHRAVVRLLWLALNPHSVFSQLPHGWAQGRFASPVPIVCGEREAEIRHAVDSLFWGHPAEFTAWFLASVRADLSAFERAAVSIDLDEIEAFTTNFRSGVAHASQLALL